MPEKKKSVFETLASIDVTEDIRVKGNTQYIPWAKCVEKLRTHYPDAIIEECTFKKQRFISTLETKTADGETYAHQITEEEMPYATDGHTAWVKTCVKIPSENIEEYCTLPILDFKNQPIPSDKVTTADANKSLRRCVAKNIAYLGYGITLWQKDNDYTDLAKDQKVIDKLESNEVIAKFKELVAKGFDKIKLANWCKENFGSSNPASIKNEEIRAKMLEALDKLDIKDFQSDKKTK